MTMTQHQTELLEAILKSLQKIEKHLVPAAKPDYCPECGYPSSDPALHPIPWASCTNTIDHEMYRTLHTPDSMGQLPKRN